MFLVPNQRREVLVSPRFLILFSSLSDFDATLGCVSPRGMSNFPPVYRRIRTFQTPGSVTFPNMFPDRKTLLPLWSFLRLHSTKFSTVGIVRNLHSLRGLLTVYV